MNELLTNFQNHSATWDRAALLIYLTAQGIAYEEVEHPPVFTMSESSRLSLALEGSRCKNLLVQDKKGTHRFLLVTAPDASLDLGALGRALGVGRLSMCPSAVMQASLHVSPGALSPLALVADTSPGKVRLLLDSSLRTVTNYLFHPLVNTSGLLPVRLTPT